MEISKRLFGPRRFYLGALSIALPIMLQGVIQSMVSLIDNFMVSGLGDISMSGVNVSGRITFIYGCYRDVERAFDTGSDFDRHLYECRTGDAFYVCKAYRYHKSCYLPLLAEKGEVA